MRLRAAALRHSAGHRGAMKESIFSGRLDNFQMLFCSVNLDQESRVRMLSLFDHEEVLENVTRGKDFSDTWIK